MNLYSVKLYRHNGEMVQDIFINAENPFHAAQLTYQKYMGDINGRLFPLVKKDTSLPNTYSINGNFKAVINR